MSTLVDSYAHRNDVTIQLLCALTHAINKRAELYVTAGLQQLALHHFHYNSTVHHLCPSRVVWGRNLDNHKCIVNEDGYVRLMLPACVAFSTFTTANIRPTPKCGTTQGKRRNLRPSDLLGFAYLDK